MGRFRIGSLLPASVYDCSSRLYALLQIHLHSLNLRIPNATSLDLQIFRIYISFSNLYLNGVFAQLQLVWVFLLGHLLDRCATIPN